MTAEGEVEGDGSSGTAIVTGIGIDTTVTDNTVDITGARATAARTARPTERAATSSTQNSPTFS